MSHASRNKLDMAREMQYSYFAQEKIQINTMFREISTCNLSID